MSAFPNVTPTVQRHPDLEKVLAELKRAPDPSRGEEGPFYDRVFDHNVPPLHARNLADRELVEHLRTTYAQKEFIIDLPAEIAQYARAGDAVIKRGTFEGLPRLEPGTTLVATAFDLHNDVVVCTKDTLSVRLPFNQLVATGYKGRFKTYTLSEGTFADNAHPFRDANGRVPQGELPMKEVRRSDLPSEKFKLIVRYDGPTLYREDGPRVEDGTAGIILGSREGMYDVAWVNGPKTRFVLEQRHSSYNGVSRFEGYVPPLLCPAESFLLVVPNPVDIEGLLRKQIKDQGEFNRGLR